MKKITIILLLLYCCCSYAQLAQESFEGTWSPVPAASGSSTDWLVLNNGIGLTNTWMQQAHTDLLPSYEELPGTHAAYLPRENVATGQVAADYLITPEFTFPVGGELRFFSRLTVANVQGSIYKVMILTSSQLANANNINSYTLIEDWEEDEINPNQLQYTEINVPFDDVYEGTTVRIAFVMEGDEMDRWLIDNVSVTYPCNEVSGLTAGAFELTSAELNWTNPPGVDKWEIEIVEQGAAPTGEGIVYNGSLPYLATEMTNGTDFVPGTDYKYYVKTLCDDGVSSDWVGAFNFSTRAYGEDCDAPITITSLPYFDSGDTADSADLYNGIAGTGCNISTQDEYLDGNDVVYSFTAGFTGNVDIELIGNEGYSGVFVYDECANIGVNCLNGGISDSFGSPVYLYSFPVTAGEDYYIVVSSSHLNLTTAYSLLIQQVTCEEPVALAPGDISMTSAELNWTNPTGATSWQLVVQQPGDGVPPAAGLMVASNTDVLVNEEFDGTDLLSGTNYEYWIRSDCGDSTFSSWAGPYTFLTALCDASAQCTHTFTMWGSTNQTWYGATMNIVQNNEVVATLTGPATAGSGQVTQTVQLCDGLPYQLIWNNGGNFPTTIGISAANAFGQVYFTKNPGQGAVGTTLFTTTAVSCDTPLCLPPTGLGVSNVNTTTVDLTWNGTPTGNWEYYIVPSGGAAPILNSVGVETTTNPAVGASFLADGSTLQASTSYQYYVRTLCDDATSDESAWAGPFAFQTAACNLDDKCGYTFTMSSMWASGWLGGTMAVKQNGATVIVLGPQFTAGATQSVTVPLCDDIPFTVEWLTGGSWSSQMGLKIANSYEQEVFNLPFFSAGLGTIIFTGTNDCDYPACIQPAGLYAENNTVTTVDLGWAGPPTGNWEYYVVEEGQPAPGASTPGTTTTANPTVGVALPTPGTNYEFYVRLACQDGSFTAWSGPHDFYSQACEDEDKCIYTFELLSKNGYGWEGNTMTVMQNGVPVATLGLTPFNGYSYTEEVAICPDTEISVYWEYTGDASYEKGLVIYTPWGYDIYTLEYNTQFQGTTIFTGTISCDPPACLKPTELEVSNVTSSEVTLGWEPGDAESEWAVWILPIGSEEPAPDSTPTFTTTQNPVTYGDDAGETLSPGTAYEYYVMSMCGPDGNSIVSDVKTFATRAVNIDCGSAFELPVNPGKECIQFVTASFEGAPTGSIVPSCITEMGEELAAVTWFSFEATSTIHSIGTSNYYGTAIWPYIAVYEGSCDGGLTEILCTHAREDVVDDLVPGNIYYVMIYNLVSPSDASSFDICIRTPESFLYVSKTDYTVPELIQDVFIGSECAYIDNIEWVTGESVGQNGIGYFTENGSGFTFPAGIVLVSADADEIPGPNREGGMMDQWDNDEVEEELQNIIGLWPPDAHGGTSIKFDFAPMQEIPAGVPLFKFIFASDEYGDPDYECAFSDVFAFILTDLDTGEAINLAVLPTGDPILVTTIHPDNGICGAYNEEYFGQYNDILAPANINGQTIPMDALTPYALQATHSYRMHMIVANQLDHLLSSAVFLLEGSMNLGAVPLGADLTVDAGTALCEGEIMIIHSNLDPALHTFLWYQDGELLEGETGADLVVEEAGRYVVNAPVTGTECVRDGEILVEFYPFIGEITSVPQQLIGCGTNGFAEFDLEQNTSVILTGLNAADYVVTYHASEEEAQEDENALESPYTNTTAWEQQIWTRVENTVTGCYGFQEAFTLRVTNLEISDNVTICEGNTATLIAELIAGEDPVTFAWTRNTEPYEGTTGSIETGEAGTYEVTVDSNGCILTASVTVTVNPLPAVDAPEDVTACDSYTLPVLQNGKYFTEPQGAGQELLAGEVIDASQTIYVFAESVTTPVCTAEESFVVTITPSVTPVTGFTLPAVICSNGTNPVPVPAEGFTTGGTYSVSAGATIDPVTGEINLATTANSTYDVTYAIAADPANCILAASTTVTVPIIDSVANITGFEYEEAYCFDIPTITPELAAGFTTGGSFSSSTGLVIDPATGVINTAVSTPGTYTVTYTIAADNTTCNPGGTASDIVTIAPEFSFELEGICDGNNYFIRLVEKTGSFDSVTFEWANANGQQVGTDSPELNVTDLVNSTSEIEEFPIDFMLTVINNGCEKSEIFSVDGISCFIQRGISPNGDGDNDFFDLSELDVAQISIFNRYGQELYTRKNYTNEWGGQSNNGDELPTGTYFYMVQRNNGEQTTGWVYINREL